MAFVLLPCDLFSWDYVSKILEQMLENPTPESIAKNIWKLSQVCRSDPHVPREGKFQELEDFLSQDAHKNFLIDAIPNLIQTALRLQEMRQQESLWYALQQQENTQTIPRFFGACLLSHIFLCTFPPRTDLFHPSLVNPSFVYLFSNLHRRSQKLKLASFLNYFRLLPDLAEMEGSITISRKVRLITPRMDDWVNSTETLSEFKIMSNGSIENHTEPGTMNCFSSEFPCRSSLTKGNGQEAILSFSHPEILLTSIICEKMDANEAIEISGVLRVASFNDLQRDPNSSLYEKITESPNTFCLIDPVDNSQKPVTQFKPEEILRELNKCLVGFGSQKNKTRISNSRRHFLDETPTRSSTNQTNCEETRDSQNENSYKQMNGLLSCPIPSTDSSQQAMPETTTSEANYQMITTASKPPLPPSRRSSRQTPNISVKKSLQVSSEEDDYFSAQESLDKDGNSRAAVKFIQSVSIERKHRKLSFTQRLKEAADREKEFIKQSMNEEQVLKDREDPTSSKESRVPSETSPHCLEARFSGGSSLDVKEPKSPTRYKNLMEEPSFKTQEMQDSGNSTEISNNRPLRASWYLSDEEMSDHNDSYSCSLSSDYNSNSDDDDAFDGLEEILHGLEQNPEERRMKLEMQSHNTLKRGFSDTFREMPENQEQPISRGSHKRSLSLHGQSTGANIQHHFSINIKKEKNEEHNIVTGNWGCGSRGGDPQLKALLQWAASSFLKIPMIKYYSYNSSNLTKLSIVVRMISDRGWTTGQLVSFLMNHGKKRMNDGDEEAEMISKDLPSESSPENCDTPTSTGISSLFDEIIGPIRTPSFPEEDDICDSFSFDFWSDS